ILTGEAKYTASDSLGHPTQGAQAFTIRLRFAHNQLATDAMRVTHSQYVSLIEAFFSGGFAPPVVSPGDTARIDSIALLSIDPPLLDKTATRSAVIAKAEYVFTIF